jgi:hypothetical protein
MLANHSDKFAKLNVQIDVMQDKCFAKAPRNILEGAAYKPYHEAVTAW